MFDLVGSVVVPFDVGAGVGWSAYRDCVRVCLFSPLLESILAGAVRAGSSCDWRCPEGEVPLVAAGVGCSLRVSIM